MTWLHRLLGRSRCRYSRHSAPHGRTRGAAKTLPRAGSASGTLDCCAGCRAQQDRERQYLQRLRDAAIPAASDDLTARLLARTEHLASLPASEPSARNPLTGRGSRLGRRGHRPGIRKAGMVTGGAAAAVTLLAGTTYLMGGDAEPRLDDAQAALFSRQAATPGPLTSAQGLEIASGPAGGWTMGGRPDFTPAGALTAGQLSVLRSLGWTCPDLRELGFHVIWARSAVVSGANLVELRLTDGRHFATVLEQHATPVPHATGTATLQQPPGSLLSAALPPENILTGHTAAADGFVAAEPGDFLPAGPGRIPVPDGLLWVNAAAPYQAIYRTDTAIFTYVSDLSADKADDAIAALMESPVSGATGTEEPDAGADIPVRMERGLGRLLGLLFP